MLLVALLIIFLLMMGYHFHRHSLLFLLVDVMWLGFTVCLLWLWTAPLGESLYLWIPYPNLTPASHLVLYQQSALQHIPQVFTRACASLMLIGFSWGVRALLHQWLRPLEVKGRHLPLVGGVLGLVIGWFALAILFATLSLIDFSFIQTLFASHAFLRWLVVKTPLVATHLLAIWFQGPVPFV